MTQKFDADGMSDPGNATGINEDSFTILWHDNPGCRCALLAVADGVGGLQHGEIASAMVIKALEDWWAGINWARIPGADVLMDSMTAAVKKANEDLCRYNAAHAIKSGTTLTALLLPEDGYRIVHVGDSRVYHIEGSFFGGIRQLTGDHVQLLPKMAGDQVVMKPYLTSCMGDRPVFECQKLAGNARSGDMFLVCTDGVYKTLGEPDIRKMVKRQKRKAGRAARDLIARAKGNGEKDNLTAAVVRILA